MGWDDLRYIFGEIMYGGHITDDWDRRLCSAYLQNIINPDLLQEGYEVTTGLVLPHISAFRHADFMSFISDTPLPEAPALYGLHANAEINFRTVQADSLFKTIQELRPRAESTTVASVTDHAKSVVEEILQQLPEPFSMAELAEKLEDDRTPGQHVFYQEAERMNALIQRVKSTLTEVEQGLTGALSMSSAMTAIVDCVILDQVPEAWESVSFATTRALGGWVRSLVDRHQQLMEWTGDLQLPRVVALNLFFNPNSFLTAVMQTSAILNSYDLDQMTLVVDVTKKGPEQIDAPAREGMYVDGLYLEGARWDTPNGCLEESRMKELHPKMPVAVVKAMPASRVDHRDMYGCPVYKTVERGATFVATFHLKSKHPAIKWTIAGVAVILDVVD